MVTYTPLATDDEVNQKEVEDRLSTLDAAITAKAAEDPVVVQIALMYDSKSTTVDGGSAAATTWNQRDINQEIDDDDLVVISSNEFVPAAGTYWLIAQAVAHDVASHKLLLYNVTQTSEVERGLNMATLSQDSDIATLMMTFTANGTDSYRIDHYSETAIATDGLGEAVGDGTAEVYLHAVLITVG